LKHIRTGRFPTAFPLGMSESPNGPFVAAASATGASIFSIKRMEQPKSSPSSWLLGSFGSKGSGAIESAVSPHNDFVFTSLEDSNEIAVFNLKKALDHGFGPKDLVGYIPVGVAPVGLAISPDGRYLYATSELNSESEDGSSTAGGEGTLTTINLHEAEHMPSRSVVSTVWAGCSPVRVVASNSAVYVTARGSDALVAFSALRLVADPGSALVGQSAVGESPVGLALVDSGRAVVVADSNRFANSSATANLAVVAIHDGRLGQLLGYLTSGAFPRDMAVSPDGRTLIVSDYSTGDVEEISVATLPTG
jgi:6-phosphogluconolactonase (cycloisomerase 2 family)